MVVVKIRAYTNVRIQHSEVCIQSSKLQSMFCLPCATDTHFLYSQLVIKTHALKFNKTIR